MKISRSKMISIITISLIVIITFVHVFYLINKTNKLNTMYAYQNNNINSNIEQEEINKETTLLEVQEPEIVTVYEDYTMEELSEQLEKSLNSDISGYGSFIANYTIEKNVDPFLATAIMLHETGCTWNCSSLVKNCHNVGGMKGSGCGSYGYFNTLEEGIQRFVDNIYNNYYAYGLTTADAMGKKYAEDPSWSMKVNNYIEKIKNR